jgi:Ca2+-transporting ATPase
MTTVHEVRDENGQLSPELTAAWNAVRLAIDGADHVAFTKGAVDSVLEASSHVWSEGTVVPLDEEKRQRLADQNAELAGEGIRVLGLAFKPVSAPPRDGDTAAVEQDLVFAGMAGMVDPVRPEAHDAVDRCVDAGIRPVMITGDHPRMAQYVARQLGMLPAEIDPQGQGANVLTGRELEAMPQEDLEGVVEDVSIYARVAPEHKLRIVDALQAKGHVCAMTGDGVNDAPALKSADIGVAMGITGTDVSKEAADMVLQNDNFATIVAAVEEGRTIYSNIRRFIRFLLACNTGELWVFLIAPFLGMPLPLLPVQILWMNLVTDGFPALGLGVEGAERDVMKRPPRDPKVQIVDRRQVVHILWVGVTIGLLSLILGFVAWRGAGAPAGIGPHGSVTAQLWQTMLFCTMVFGQLSLALAERSDRASLLTIGLGSNPYLLAAVGGSFLLQLAVVYVPILQTLFRTTALSIGQLLACLAAGAVVFMAVEVGKAIGRRGIR